MGAEGTLGVITELVVRVFPRPKKRVGAVVTFADTRSATSAVVEATQRLNLETLLRCELLNDEGVACTNAVFQTTLAKRPTLFLEFVSARDANDPTPRRDWETFREMAMTKHNAVDFKFAPNSETLDTLWDARRGLPRRAQVPRRRGRLGEKGKGVRGRRVRSRLAFNGMRLRDGAGV